MQNLKNKSLDLIKNSTLVRYIMTGGTAYILEMAVLLSLSEVFKLNSTIAISIAFWFGLVISFFMQKILAFQNTNTKPEEISSQGIYYGLLIAFNFIFTLIFTSIFAPIISLIFARTLALIATTFWNYFIYKKIIFNKKFTADNFITSSIKNLIKFNKKYPIIMPAIFLSIFLFTLLVVMSALSQTVADDYSYFAWIRRLPTPFHYAYEHYITHNGRLSQAVTVAGLFHIFGERLTKVAPLLLATGLSLSLAWLIGLLFRFKRNQKIISLTAGALLSSIIIFAVPSTFDSFLWLTSSTVHTASVIVLIANICLSITLARQEKIHPIAIMASLVFMIFSQSFSEPAAAVAIGSACLWLGYEIFTKNRRNIILAAQITTALIVGFLIILLSPGTRSRQTNMNSGVDLHNMFIKSLQHYSVIFNNLDLWMLGLVVFTAIFIGLNLKTRFSLKDKMPLLAVTGIFFTACTYGSFVVSNYAAGRHEMALRTFSLPTAGWVISLTLTLVLLVNYTVTRFKSQSELFLSLCAILILVMSLAGVTKSATTQIKSLAIRESFVNSRNLDVLQQLQEDQSDKEIDIKATPVLVKSQAVDIENPDINQTDWLISSVKSYYGIPKKYTLKIEATPEQYCLTDITKTKPEFVCK